MKPYRIVFEMQARETFRHLPPSVKPLLKQVIEELSTDPSSGKQLHEELSGYLSVRYQRWRILYTVDTTQRRIVIQLIDRRVTVYEALKRFPPLTVHETLTPYHRASASVTKSA